MIATRWEKERAAWVLARSRAGTSARRRAELLGRQARRRSRSGAGVAETSLREEITPSLMRRLLTTEEGAKEQLARLILVPVGLVVVGLLVGPALAIAAALYGALWYWSPKIGRLWAWPWLAGGTALFVGGAWLIGRLDTGIGAWVEGLSGLHLYLPVFLPVWGWVQTSLALLLVAAQITRSGWAAVGKGAVPRSEKDKNGNFKKTPEKQKVRLDPLAGVEVEQPAESTQKVALSALILEPEPEPADDEIDDLPPLGNETDNDEPGGDVDDTKKETDHV